MSRQDKQSMEEMLEAMRPQADPDFYLSLRHRVLSEFAQEISSKSDRGSAAPRVSRWQAIAAGLVLVVLFLALTPTGRTWAQQILRIGVFIVTDEPSLAERWLDRSHPEDGIHSLRAVTTSPDEASEIAGFSVYYPTYLPARYQPTSKPPIKILFDTQGEIRSAEAMFHRVDSGDILFFTQQLFPPDEELSLMPLDAGDARVEPATVGGSEALWLADYVWGTRPDETGELQPVEYNVLLWTMPAGSGARYYFWLGSEGKLSRAEMLRIAESMIAQ